ncbi:MAG: hypothetical protein HQK52_19485 [Oligoflexia bacterium]|nr:hypothetical protein [Oligoflexia bacterium]
MSINKLDFIKENTTVKADYWNQIIFSLLNDIVGRDSDGRPKKGGNLGNDEFPFGEIWCDRIIVHGKPLEQSASIYSKQSIFSGKTSDKSSKACFLDLDQNKIILRGKDTPFVYSVNGLQAVKITEDIALTVNYKIPEQEIKQRTAYIDNIYYFEAPWTTKETSFNISGDESYLKTLVGKTVSAKIDKNNGTHEIITATLSFVEKKFLLENIRRSDIGNTPPVRLKDKDKVTILSTAWVFVDVSKNIIINFNNPIYTTKNPGLTGVYWFDLNHSEWYIENEKKEVTLIGHVVFDFSGSVGIKSADFTKKYSKENYIKLKLRDESLVQDEESTYASVYGEPTTIKEIDVDIKSIPHNSSAYIYLDDRSKAFLLDVPPVLNKQLNGYYHYKESWRALGLLYHFHSDQADEILISNYIDSDDEYCFVYHDISSTVDFKKLRSDFLLTKLGAKFVKDETSTATNEDDKYKLKEAFTFRRPLNTIVSPSKFCSIKGDEILILPGKYLIKASVAIDPLIKTSSINLQSKTVDIRSTGMPLIGMLSLGNEARVSGIITVKQVTSIWLDHQIGNATMQASAFPDIDIPGTSKLRMTTIEIKKLGR